MTKKSLDELTYKIIGAAIEVHKVLGPGLLESVYHKCLKHEFFVRNLSVASEFLVPIRYKAVEVDTDLRCDFLVEDQIVCGDKSGRGNCSSLRGPAAYLHETTGKAKEHFNKFLLHELVQGRSKDFR